MAKARATWALRSHRKVYRLANRNCAISSWSWHDACEWRGNESSCWIYLQFYLQVRSRERERERGWLLLLASALAQPGIRLTRSERAIVRICIRARANQRLVVSRLPVLERCWSDCTGKRLLSRALGIWSEKWSLPTVSFACLIARKEKERDRQRLVVKLENSILFQALPGRTQTTHNRLRQR